MKLKILALSLLAVPLVAAPPRISNGSVQSLPSLTQAEAMPGTGWVGYTVEAAKPLYISCCGRLGTDDGFSINRRDPDDLGPSNSNILMFARLRDKQVDRLRFFSPDC